MRRLWGRLSATEWSEPVTGWEFHPCNRAALHGGLFRQQFIYRPTAGLVLVDQSRTFISGYSITSLPGGTGIHIVATPDSERRELQARHVNQSCLRSFSRCEELCQLLPDAISILDDRGWHWADCARDIH